MVKTNSKLGKFALLEFLKENPDKFLNLLIGKLAIFLKKNPQN